MKKMRKINEENIILKMIVMEDKKNWTEELLISFQIGKLETEAVVKDVV